MKTISKLPSPIRYFGGKGKMVSKLLPYIPEHQIYCEVFGGGASLLFAKKPAEIEIYNDLDSNLVNLFRVLRDEEKFEKFYKKVCLTPYSREEWQSCKETYNIIKDDIERAYRFFVALRQGFSGQANRSWSFIVNDSSRGMAGTCSRWLSTIEMLPEIHQRVMTVQIEHDDFRKIIPRYDTENTFFYLDPPYIPETRKDGGYHHEMTLSDHKDLVEILLNIKGKVMLSGYAHSIYEPLSQWKRIDFKTACHATGRTRHTKVLGNGSATKICPRVETIWINF